MNRLGNYLRDTMAEMKHVVWPTQAQALTYTALVVFVSLIVALFLGLFDYGFSQLLNIIIK
jgi:preprotein translocase subunit SecE